MYRRQKYGRYLSVVIVVVLCLVMGGWTQAQAQNKVEPPIFESGPISIESGLMQDAAPNAATRNLVLSYAAKFVCTEALAPGQFWYGLAAPIVQQKTEVLIHNPNAFPVTLYKKAVRAPLEDPNKVEQGVAPGKWNQVSLAPDYAFRIDCDDIAKLLTGNPNATFVGTYGVGVTVEGFVVIGIGQQPVAGSNLAIFGQLDVTAEYVRSSEVFKKDIHYQPWWRWWWWPLPWRLGYAYQRILPIDSALNIDCRGDLYNALRADVEREFANNPQVAQLTLAALDAGNKLEPASVHDISAETTPALVALIGRCDKISTTAMSVDYLLVSNQGPTDPDPRGIAPAVASQVRYPWLPGRWYDLALATPQNLDVDLHDYFHTWQAKRWEAAGESAATIQQALVYYFPYWCGWGYWWWWWNAGDCIDVGVGEGESLDVESITPVRVFMPQWPPVAQ